MPLDPTSDPADGLPAATTPADQLLAWDGGQLQLTLPAGMVAALAEACQRCPVPTAATAVLARALPRRTPGGPRRFRLDQPARAQWQAAVEQLAATVDDRPAAGAAATLAKLLARAAVLHPDAGDTDRQFAAIVEASLSDPH